MIETPLASLDAYIEYLTGADLPVLRHTKRQLDETRANLDRVTARQISQIVLQDPLMAVKVLYYIQPFRGKSLRSDITTVGSAIMMLGIEPFFNKFADLITVEDRLADQPQALLGAVRTIGRVQRAAHWAQDWAYWRHDLNAEEVTMATLLHDLAEIVIWCFAPKLTLEVQRRQRADQTLRTIKVQEDVFGITIYDLQRALNRAWHLPELLQRLTDDNHDDVRRVRNVSLAIDLARHAANGWTDAALPDDFRNIAELLNVTVEAVIERIGVPEDVLPAVLAMMAALPPPGPSTPPLPTT